MESHYSILKFVNNPLSGENISLGLIVISDQDVYFRLSTQKLSIAKKLNPHSISLLEYSLEQLRNFLAYDLADQSYKLIQFKKTLDTSFLNRLSNYNNGILQFSKPSFIKATIDGSVFDSYFKKFIDDNIVDEKLGEVEPQKNISQLKYNIEQNLYIPLKDKIDVNYTLNKKVLPSLFFDFHLDGIGVNGAMYAAKSVDLNSNRQIGQIVKEISEYESVIDRLNKFAELKQITGDHQYFLIADQYNGKSLSYMDLYSLLKESNMPFFKLISSNEIDIIVNLVNKNKARKFSEELEVA